MIITICNFKGGVGKTTTAVTLAHGLAIKGHRTLIVDADPQGQVAPSLGESHDRTFYLLLGGAVEPAEAMCSLRPNLHVVPGNQMTTFIANWIFEGVPAPSTMEHRHEFVASGKDSLTRTIHELGKLVEFTIIDTSHSMDSIITPICMAAADAILVPVALDHLALTGLHALLTFLAELSEYKQIALLGVLPTFYDEVTNESRINLEHIHSALDGHLIMSSIHRATVFRECAARGKTIFEIDGESRAAREYAEVVKTVEAYKRWLDTPIHLGHNDESL